MRREIEKAVENFNKGEITKGEMQNEILRLSIIKKDEIKTCSICKEHILMSNGTCPDCTIDLCTPFTGWDE